MLSIRSLLKLKSKFQTHRYSTMLTEHEFTTTPFCNVDVIFPFNVTLVPLDVHKYSNSDRVIVKIKSENCIKNPLKFECTEKAVKVFSDITDYSAGVICKIEAPIKANINVTTTEGNISLLNFHGDGINLKSEHGNIIASNCFCDKIWLKTTTGNISCPKVMQAREIYLKTNSGTIKTGRLQGSVLNVESESGDCFTESSYCNDSTFTTVTGSFDLQSAHKHCNIVIGKKGNLNLVGFDGTLRAFLSEGNADVQLSRIESDSIIQIEKEGHLKLRISEDCLNKTKFKIFAQKLDVDEDFVANAKSVDDFVVLSTDCGENKLLIDCKQSNVVVKNSSWMEMFRLNVPKDS